MVATNIFCLNELGRRANNEDCVSPPKGEATPGDIVFMVCDGVGGEQKGEVASEIVCTAVRSFFLRPEARKLHPKEAVLKSVQAANTSLTTYAATDVAAKRMSTTLALAYLTNGSVFAAWCGDTRIHHIRGNKVLWKSRDHSLVSELISQGELTEEEARRHPRRNVITRSLNALNYNNVVDIHEIKNPEPGDCLLLCSDGFLENVTEDIILQIIADQTRPDKAAAFLSVCEGRTRDNFSMYLFQLADTKDKPKKSAARLRFWLLTLLALLLLGLVIFLAGWFQK